MTPLSPLYSGLTGFNDTADTADTVLLTCRHRGISIQQNFCCIRAIQQRYSDTAINSDTADLLYRQGSVATALRIAAAEQPEKNLELSCRARAAGEPYQQVLGGLEHQMQPAAGGGGSECERAEARRVDRALESPGQPCG